MKKYIGFIETNRVGSKCEFEFEADELATEEELEELAKESAFNLVNWNYWEQP